MSDVMTGKSTGFLAPHPQSEWYDFETGSSGVVPDHWLFLQPFQRFCKQLFHVWNLFCPKYSKRFLFPALNFDSYISTSILLGCQSYDKPRQCIIKQSHHFADKGLCSQSYGFSSSRIWMWELDHKEGWVLNNWFLWIEVLDKTHESPLDSKISNQSILKESTLNIHWKY